MEHHQVLARGRAEHAGRRTRNGRPRTQRIVRRTGGGRGAAGRGRRSGVARRLPSGVARGRRRRVSVAVELGAVDGGGCARRRRARPGGLGRRGAVCRARKGRVHTGRVLPVPPPPPPAPPGAPSVPGFRAVLCVVPGVGERVRVDRGLGCGSRRRCQVSPPVPPASAPPLVDLTLVVRRLWTRTRSGGGGSGCPSPAFGASGHS